MTKKSNCNCNYSHSDLPAKGASVYVVVDHANDELVASGVNFNEIEKAVVDYIDDNGFNEDDVDISVYIKTSIEVDVSRITKVRVSYN